METAIELYFIFSLHNSLFAVPAVAVQETLRLPEITPVEEMPPQVVGVINLRGRIIAVADLDICFGRYPSPYRLSDGLVVLKKQNGRRFGLIVHEVHEVKFIAQEDIDPPPFPERKDAPRSRCVIGEARVGEDIIMLIDHNLIAGDAEFLLDPPSPDDQDSGELQEVTMPPPYSPVDFFPQDREIFHGRAVDLMDKADTEDETVQLQVAVVCLQGEFFGVELSSVREFSHLVDLSPIPNCPAHIVGNMNLRGNILTVIDIKGLLEMPGGIFVAGAKVIVTEAGKGRVGIAVDAIDDIARIPLADIAPLPSSGQPALRQYTKGTALYGGRSMTILDIAGIMNAESLVVQ